MQKPEKNLPPRLNISPGAPDTGTTQRGHRLKETGKAGKEQVAGAPSTSGPRKRNSRNRMSSVKLSAGAGYAELGLTVGPGEGWLGNWDNPQV